MHFLGGFPYLASPLSINGAYLDPGGTLQVFTTQVIGGVPPPMIPTRPFTMVSLPQHSFASRTEEHRTVLFAP